MVLGSKLIVLWGKKREKTKWFVLGFDPEGRIKKIKEREQVKRRWWGNLWDNLYFHLPSPHLGYFCFLCKRGLAAEQCLQKGQCWATASISFSVVVLPKPVASAPVRAATGTPLVWRENLFLSCITSPHVLTFLCYCRSTKGITLKLAGNNHLVPVPRVTDDDLGVLVSVLGQAAFVTGKVFPCVFDIVVLIWWSVLISALVHLYFFLFRDQFNVDMQMSHSLFFIFFRFGSCL